MKDQQRGFYFQVVEFLTVVAPAMLCIYWFDSFEDVLLSLCTYGYFCVIFVRYPHHEIMSHIVLACIVMIALILSISIDIRPVTFGVFCGLGTWCNMKLLNSK